LPNLDERENSTTRLQPLSYFRIFKSLTQLGVFFPLNCIMEGFTIHPIPGLISCVPYTMNSLVLMKNINVKDYKEVRKTAANWFIQKVKKNP